MSCYTFVITDLKKSEMWLLIYALGSPFHSISFHVVIHLYFHKMDLTCSNSGSLPFPHLSHNHTLETSHVSLLGGNLKVSVDDAVKDISKVQLIKWYSEDLRHSHQDASSTAQCTHKVASDRQSSNTSTTKSSSGWNNTLQLAVHALITVTGHNQALLFQLLSHIARAGSRNLDPSLAESGTCDEHVDGEYGSVDGVQKGIGDVERWAHVVDQSAGWKNLRSTLASLPHSEHLDQKVVGKLVVQHLGNEEDIGGQGGLEHDGHVRGVEEADGVGAAHTTLARGLDGDLHTEACALLANVQQ